METLATKRCLPCEGGTNPLSKEEIQSLLKQTPDWQYHDASHEIKRDFQFKNFYHTMAFVNAIAYIANQENHHPDLEVGYNYCKVRFSTHAIGGLSENDFICAAKVNSLITAPVEKVCKI